MILENRWSASSDLGDADDGHGDGGAGVGGLLVHAEEAGVVVVDDQHRRCARRLRVGRLCAGGRARVADLPQGWG